MALQRLSSFDQSAIRRWRDSWTTTKPSTIRLRLNLLKAFFAHALREEWINKSPMLNVQNPKIRPDPTLPLSHDEIRVLIAAARAGRENTR